MYSKETMFHPKILTQLIVCYISWAVVVECRNATVPTRFGVIVFPGFEALDVFGTIEALNLLSEWQYMNLSIIADTLDPVATNRMSWRINPVNSTFGQQILPTHTFETAPELDVLIVPGGIGSRAPVPLLDSVLNFIKNRYPHVQYLLTVCTGAGVAARSGVLDGIYATTNKRAWAETTADGPNVKWVPQARWVVDGNIWTSSGVSAGMDLMIAFVSSIWGNATATDMADIMEYTFHTVSTDDPFAGLYNLSAPANGTTQPLK